MDVSRNRPTKGKLDYPFFWTPSKTDARLFGRPFSTFLPGCFFFQWLDKSRGKKLKADARPDCHILVFRYSFNKRSLYGRNYQVILWLLEVLKCIGNYCEEKGLCTTNIDNLLRPLGCRKLQMFTGLVSDDVTNRTTDRINRNY